MRTIYLNSAYARSIARSLWGEVNHVYKTGHMGAYYFSCSSHGGYVVDGNVLTDEQRENIEKYVTPYEVYVEVNRNTGDVRVQNPCSSQGFHYSPYNQIVTDHKIFVFEEDCDWSVLEKFTDIRPKEKRVRSEEQHREVIERCFNRYYGAGKDAEPTSVS